jgi:hypothetical protein
MANKIQIRRGLKTNLPSLDVGEPALCTDTKEVFVGNSGGNVALINKEVMDEHLKNYTLQVPYAQAAGSANTYTVTLNPPLTGYTEGVAVAVKIDASNTGASTININGRGAKSIRDPRGNALKAGKLTAGSIYTLRYNGTNFILQGEGSTGNALASDLLSGKTASTDAGDITGTMPSNGSQTATLTTQGASKVVPAGYTSGGTITASFSNLSAGNVKSGVNVGGVTGTYAPLAGYMWTQRTSGFTRNIEAIAYGQGMFVIADFDSNSAHQVRQFTRLKTNINNCSDNLGYLSICYIRHPLLSSFIQSFSSTDDIQDFIRYGCLSGLIHSQGQGFDDFSCIIGGVAHGGHPGTMLTGFALQHGVINQTSYISRQQS